MCASVVVVHPPQGSKYCMFLDPISWFMLVFHSYSVSSNLSNHCPLTSTINKAFVLVFCFCCVNSRDGFVQIFQLSSFILAPTIMPKSLRSHFLIPPYSEILCFMILYTVLLPHD